MPAFIVRTVLFRPAAVLLPVYDSHTGRSVVAAKDATTPGGKETMEHDSYPE